LELPSSTTLKLCFLISGLEGALKRDPIMLAFSFAGIADRFVLDACDVLSVFLISIDISVKSCLSFLLCDKDLAFFFLLFFCFFKKNSTICSVFYFFFIIIQF
jgi:hypothetical protein